jgi:hypothetical protein
VLRLRFWPTGIRATFLGCALLCSLSVFATRDSVWSAAALFLGGAVFIAARWMIEVGSAMHAVDRVSTPASSPKAFRS